MYIIIPVLLSTETLPDDLPTYGVVLPLQVIEPTEDDMRMFSPSGQGVNVKFRDFVRMRQGQISELVSSSKQKSDGKKSMNDILARGGESWSSKNQERLAGFNYCRVVMANFRGRLYFLSKNGLSYELDKTHWFVLAKLYVCLCKCIVDGQQQLEIERRNIEDYIATILAGDEPGIDTSALYEQIKVVNETKSKAHTDKYQRIKDRGLETGIDAYNALENPVDDRFVNELHDLAGDIEKDFISFATPLKIVQALGGDHGHLLDIDVQKYRGCIITDLQELIDEMGFEKWGLKEFLKNIRNYFKTASCNPCVVQRGLRDGDVFIFHHDNFFGGEEGEAAVNDVHVRGKTVVYENGKKKE